MCRPDSNSEWIAEERREIAKGAINRAFDSSLTLLKWVLTSVAVFHSAGLVAGFNSEELSSLMFSGPAWAFLIGIGLALGAGLTLAVGAADYASRMSNSLWKGEGLDTEDNETFDPEPTKTVYLGATLLGLSIAAFLLGIGSAAYQITQEPTPASSKGIERYETRRPQPH
jgi:hypothetical protein